jgi:NAD(P)-dependent dehydrogenase (short-subunit alcohol dehydrogenase family)
MLVEGKIAVVTGGAQGIGQSVAATLAREGADIVVVDIDASRCQETVTMVESVGAEGSGSGRQCR